MKDILSDGYEMFSFINFKNIFDFSENGEKNLLLALEGWSAQTARLG